MIKRVICLLGSDWWFDTHGISLSELSETIDE